MWHETTCCCLAARQLQVWNDKTHFYRCQPKERKKRKLSTYSIRLGIIRPATVNAAENKHMNTDPFILWKAPVICHAVIEFFLSLWLPGFDKQEGTGEWRCACRRLLIPARRRVASAIYRRDDPSINSQSVQITGRGLQTPLVCRYRRLRKLVNPEVFSQKTQHDKIASGHHENPLSNYVCWKTSIEDDHVQMYTVSWLNKRRK